MKLEFHMDIKNKTFYKLLTGQKPGLSFTIAFTPTLIIILLDIINAPVIYSMTVLAMQLAWLAFLIITHVMLSHDRIHFVGTSIIDDMSDDDVVSYFFQIDRNLSKEDADKIVSSMKEENIEAFPGLVSKIREFLREIV